MPVASRQSAGLLTYSSDNGALPAFTGAQPGRCRSSAGVCVGPTGATMPSQLFPVPSRLFRVLAGRYRFFPVTPGGIKHNTFPVESRFILDVPGGALVHPGRAPVHPCRSRITHWGSAGIIVRLGL
ncbi:hypothetical protein DPMN_133183 [Dreissena polymorpha]|uniref:Uncharacterized protein n=1 Tax=Dreissena polymorpha TaxID=45954 RepID=A0A9D4J9J0_DREPO|nr:hypothetical protein DPMN_133183 [Dreissena polymorpha]